MIDMKTGGIAASCVAVLLALVFGSGVASAGGKDPGGGGSSNCEPLTYVSKSGSTIYFNGYTKCVLPLPYTLQIGYGANGTGNYSEQISCYPGDGQWNCGFDGVTKSLVDDRAGVQQWCVVTFMNRPNGSGKTDVLRSVPGCIYS